MHHKSYSLVRCSSLVTSLKAASGVGGGEETEVQRLRK
jgi:hypothetical protein